MKDTLAQALRDAQTLLADFCENPAHVDWLEKIALALAQAFKEGRQILICGNGGSYCDALHFAEEFTGQFRGERPALPVMALADPAHLTCVANDLGFEQVFARGVEAFGKPQDWLLVLSTSGNSKNLIAAVEKAKTKGMRTLALLGKTGGVLKGTCEHELLIPGKTSDRIQELHMMVLHILIEGVERQLFPHLY